MNTRHHIAPFWFELLLLALLHAPASLAQAPSGGSFLPEGIEATSDTTEVRALTAWVDEHRHADPEQARQAAERALALARELDDKIGIGWSLINLGKLAPDPFQAEEYYTDAQEIFGQIRDERGLNHSRLGMGNVYRRRGDMERALTAYFNALEGFERLDDIEGQAWALNNTGITHQNQDNLEESLDYYERAARFAETLDNPVLSISILINLGYALSEYGSHERAESVLRRGLAISKEQGFRRYTATLSNNLGFLFNLQGHHEQALPPLLTAERVGNQLGETGLLIAVNDELGKAYMGLGRYDRALHYANESLVLAREARSSTRQMEAHQTLSQIYEASGDYEQALTHHRRYAAARDSVLNKEKAEILTEMETRYETEDKQRAIERLEQENQIQALRASRRQTLLLAGVGGLLLLLAFLFSRYRLKQKANRLLEDLDAAKSRFFANISHEFRTPLTVILGEVQDVLAGRFGDLPPKLVARCHAMLRNTRHLQRLIDEMLDLNRLESGKLELHPAPGDLVHSLRRIVEADAPLAERNGIELTFKHDVEDCPRLYDQEKLEKIVGNLLSNALKFTPKGGAVWVVLRCNEDVEISVTDDGPGIPEEAQAKVFERFTQVEDGSQHGGTGIGLALAKDLAELHGGMITLESTLGEGCTFTVRLPLEKVDFDDVGALREVPLSRTTEPAPPEESAVGGDGHEKRQDVGATLVVAQQTEETDGNVDRTTVLIIEDNADVRAYVRRSLEETYRVLEAADGEAGFQQACSELPDLIISDVMLPGIDGYEVARRLKAEADTECIPVVMLTARAAEEDKTEGYGTGAEVYITKPFSAGTLRAAIARLLEERQRLRRRLQEDTHSEGEEASQNSHRTLSDRARAIVLANLHEEDFGVEELAAALRMSRRTLYRHVKEEVGLSSSNFVRTLRLEHARELLTHGAGSVSEVAYAVGFKSLSHFTRSFRDQYGKTPSSVLETREN